MGLILLSAVHDTAEKSFAYSVAVSGRLLLQQVQVYRAACPAVFRHVVLRVLCLFLVWLLSCKATRLR